ncbi:MAG TPA: substrate-binding domain-containing protein [Solirubrobacterales bacterium]|nr:substrate-binding domain-containing protein [Solirubrobacterales bacterium]
MADSRRWARAAVMGIAAATIGLGLAACGGDSGGGGPKIALLLPESKTTRYEAHDHPEFEDAVNAACSDCDIIYSNADQDAAKQQSQLEAALTDGADVVVLDPVDSASAASMADRAAQQNVPIVSYDRLILNTDNVDYYVSFDNVRVGELQGEALSKKLADDGNPTGPIIKINGSPTDNNAKLFGQGADSELSKAGVQVAQEYDTPDWSPDKAQSEMDQGITAVGKTGFKGVYAMNDGTAGGAIAAMSAAGVDPTTVPTTGQDAELEAVQRILGGQQYMTVFKATKPEAKAAADIAVAIAQDKPVPAGLVNGKTDNGNKDVQSVLLTPVAVTKDNLTTAQFGGQKLIGSDGYWTPDEICTSQYQSACQQAGIS